MNQSLFERIGGDSAVMAAGDLFYKKVLADPITHPFFNGLDIDSQTKKLVGFMAWAFGGPQEYKGKDLRSAHANTVKNKGLSDIHFDAVARHLDATLNELGVAKDLINEALAIVASTRNEVLNR